MVVNRVDMAYAVYQRPRIFNSTRVSRAEEKKDYVVLSSKAKDFQNVKNALSKVPDIREDKVREVSEKLRKIEAGEYKVETSDIADKIVSRYSK